MADLSSVLWVLAARTCFSEKWQQMHNKDVPSPQYECSFSDKNRGRLWLPLVRNGPGQFQKKVSQIILSKWLFYGQLILQWELYVHAITCLKTWASRSQQRFARHWGKKKETDVVFVPSNGQPSRARSSQNLASRLLSCSMKFFLHRNLERRL